VVTQKPKNVSTFTYESFEENANNYGIWLPEFLKTIWRHRYLIVLATGASVFLAAVYCFFATPLYLITCQVRPGITAFDHDGNAKRSWSPKDIKTYFSSKANWKAAAGPTELDKLPRKINTNVSGSIIEMKLYFKDPEMGKTLVNKMLKKLNSQNTNANLQMILSRKVVKQRLDQAIQRKKELSINRDKLNSEISKIQNKIKLINQEINMTNQKIVLSKEMLERCERIIGEVSKNTQDLLEYRKRMITKKNLRFYLL